MKIIIPFIVFGSLLVGGCGIKPATTNSPAMSDEQKNDLLRSNKLVCVGDSLYFVSYVGGHPVITSPVTDSTMRVGVISCNGGITLEQFEKFK